VFTARLEAGLATTELAPEQRQAVLRDRTDLAALDPPASLSAERRDAVRARVDASFLDGFRIVMASMAALALVAAGVAWTTVPTGRVGGDRGGERDGADDGA